MHAQDGSFRNPLLSRSDQVCAAGLVVVAAFAMTLALLIQGVHKGHRVDTDRGPQSSQKYELAMNSAAWPEWVLLPGIGETLARRIVASRDNEGAFRRPDDLLRVKGIGPHKLANLRPYLGQNGVR